jgi:hypothetical protein
MRQITIRKDGLEASIEITEDLIKHIASRKALPDSAITDAEIVKFFVEASTRAFDKARSEYVDSDGKTS